MKKVWAYFDNVGAQRGQEWPIAYRQPEEDRIELLRAFGVRRFTALNYPHKPGMAAWLNDWSGTSPPGPRTPCTARRSSPSRTRPRTSPGRWPMAPGCSRRMCRSAAMIRARTCSIRYGGC